MRFAYADFFIRPLIDNFLNQLIQKLLSHVQHIIP